MGKEKRKNHFRSSSVSLFYLRLRGSHHLVRSMAEEKETPTIVNVKVAKKSLLPLQDPWYCSSSLFPMVPTDISASDVPSQWNIRGEAPNTEIAWVPLAPGVMDLRLQRKELLPSPMQFWCPSGLLNGWSDWLDREIENEGFCQALCDANIFEAVLMSRGWYVFRDIISLQYLIRCWSSKTHTFFFSWGETTVTLEDVERLFLLPSMGKLNPMDLELNSEEAKIEEGLYKAFGGCMASLIGQRARFSSWIAAFKKPGNRAIGRASFLAMWLSKCSFGCYPT